MTDKSRFETTEQINPGAPAFSSDPFGAFDPGQFNGGFDPHTPFVEADERPVASLENGVIANIITGEGLKTEGILITQKRLYYNFNVGILSKRKQNDVIELKDISATKLKDVCNWWYLIFCIVFVVAFIGILASGKNSLSVSAISAIPVFAAAVVMLILFFNSIHKSFRVEYAGGHISFDLRGYTMENMLAFQKAVHYYKCKLDK